MNTTTYVVPGGTGGIGSASTRRLVGSGANVLIAGRDPETLAIIARETGAVPHACDARDVKALEGCMAAATQRYGRIDGVANCVGSLLLKPALANASLSVGGPNNFYASTSAKGGALAIDLAETGPLADGIYHYQLTASGREMVADKSKLDNGRDGPDKAEHPVRVSSSGTFQVKGGAIVARDKTKAGRKDQ